MCSKIEKTEDKQAKGAKTFLGDERHSHKKFLPPVAKISAKMWVIYDTIYE